MIAALAIALQLAATTSAVTVRAGERAVTVPVVADTERAGARADATALALGGGLRQNSAGEHVLDVGGAQIRFTPGLPFARIDTVVVPLTTAPWMIGASLYVPLQVVTELIPRFATGFFYDSNTDELRRFVPVAAARPRAEPSPSVRGAPADVTRVEPPVRRTPATRRVVVVDAGHGGPDNGMSGPMGGGGPRIYEKHITLAVARRVAAELRQAGLQVVMTRTTDTLIALSDRGRIANRARGDVFLSIHVNAAPTTWPNPSAGRGFETYFLAEAKTEDARRVEQMENESVRFETGAHAPRGDPLSFIINDMAQNEHLRESNDLASAVQAELQRVHPGPNRGVKQANFAVLRHSFMPAVLIEIGFGTNPSEAAFMASEEGQRAIAGAIANAATSYLAAYEQRVGGTR